MPKRIVSRPFLDRFYIKSVNADRSIAMVGVGFFCKKGEWVEVPKRLYDDIKTSIEAGEKAGSSVGWAVKRDYQKVEVNK